jgi:molybdate transport system substrate-binding protein
MSRHRLGLVLVAALCACVLGTACKHDGSGTTKTPIRVAAAADLTAAFEELGSQFERETGETVSLSFGSTGLLSKQIEEGAPFDLLAAANVSYVDKVVAAGACDGASKTLYARGRIAIWTRRAFRAPASIAELADARFVRIAIANPDHAPYGVAARDALTAAGIWQTIRPRVVYGENVRQALQLAETGNVEAAIVALSLVIQKKDGSWSPVDESLHQPIDQAMVVCRRGARSDGARAFAAFVSSSSGREIMRRYGFFLPGEAVSTP